MLRERMFLSGCLGLSIDEIRGSWQENSLIISVTDSTASSMIDFAFYVKLWDSGKVLTLQ